MKRICPDCKKRPMQKHFNSKRCKPCAVARAKRPVGRLNETQIEMVIELKGTIYCRELAQKIGSSLANLKRWARDNKINLNAHKTKPEIVKMVTDYYIEHGFNKTREQFPNIKIRSIVDGYLAGVKPRQVRWNDEQLIYLAKTGGLVSKTYLASYFKRPNAYAGSINSAYTKRFNGKMSNINGLAKWYGEKIVKNSCPIYKTNVWERKTGSKYIMLWVDVEKHMKDDVLDIVKKAVQSMAKFQRWLHGSNVRESIENILKDEYEQNCK